jgi:CRP/FNR family cyclic AMP-dependent transcriptional regulator
MISSRTVRLLELEPDLGRFLTDDDVKTLDGFAVPVIEVAAGDVNLAAVMASHHAFGAVLLEGMLVRRLVVGEAATLRLVGPGDVVSALPGLSSVLIADSGWRAVAPTTMAALGRDVLLAAHSAPRLVAGLSARSAEQADRVALQLAVCQLSRVEDRVLSLLWLLAESWGQVTAQGTALRMHLTHETIGGLVGARRSTVTLAVGELTDAGAILRQERGWLLLERPRVAAIQPAPEPDPELLDPLVPLASTDSPIPSGPTDVAARVNQLRDATERLAGVGVDARRRLERDLKRLVETRRRSFELRTQALARRGSSAAAGLHHDDHTGDGVGATQGETDDPAAERLAPPVDRVDD